MLNGERKVGLFGGVVAAREPAGGWHKRGIGAECGGNLGFSSCRPGQQGLCPLCSPVPPEVLQDRGSGSGLGRAWRVGIAFSWPLFSPRC